MDTQLLTHLMALVERTGDRLVVVDSSTRKPFVVMGLAQYEALLGTATHADQNARAPRAPFRSFRAEEGSPDTSRGEVGDPARGSFVDAGSAVDVVPGIDPIARRGNAELAAWRAETPTDVAAPEPVVLPRSVPTMESFSIEPLQSAARTDDQFYVEPIE